MFRFLTLILFCLSISFPAYSELRSIIDPRVVDGDTIQLDLQVAGLPPIKLRLLGVDTPEIHGKCASEIKRAQAAKAYLINLLKGKIVQYEIEGWDKYGGRVDGNAFINGESIAQLLIQNGYGVPYAGGERKNWCS